MNIYAHNLTDCLKELRGWRHPRRKATWDVRLSPDDGYVLYGFGGHAKRRLVRRLSDREVALADNDPDAFIARVLALTTEGIATPEAWRDMEQAVAL